MAKLNGVKTLDMQNGEVTKVEYNGEVYEKVDGEIQAGDIGLVRNAWGDQNVGEYFVIKRVTSNYGKKIAYIDGNTCNANAYTTDFIPLRKVNATAESLSVGDTVKLTIADGARPKHGYGKVKNGEVGKVKAVYDHKIVVDFPSQSSWSALPSELTKVADELAPTYRLVTDREPKAGDFVKFSQKYVCFEADLSADKYYEITAVKGEFVYFNDDENDKRVKNPHHAGVEVYEKVIKSEMLTHNGATYTLVDRKAQPGDVVVFTENTSCHFRSKTKPYGPVSDDLKVPSDGYGNTKVYSPDFNRTPADVKVYAQVAPKVKPLQVGDFAKVVGDDFYGNGIEGHGFSVGTIIKIKVVDESGHRQKYEGKALNSTKMDYFVESDLVKATNEEVAAAKAEAERKTVFEKFSVGDIARTLVGKDVPVDTLVKIVEVDRDDSHRPFKGVILGKENDNYRVSEFDWYGVDQLEKLSAEEVEKMAETEKWAAIGRKPNEFKKGDVVRGIGRIRSGEFVGYIENLPQSETDGTGIRSYNDGEFRSINVTELITPVEARFDLQ